MVVALTLVDIRVALHPVTMCEIKNRHCAERPETILIHSRFFHLIETNMWYLHFRRIKLCDGTLYKTEAGI